MVPGTSWYDNIYSLLLNLKQHKANKPLEEKMHLSLTPDLEILIHHYACLWSPLGVTASGYVMNNIHFISGEIFLNEAS